MNRIPYEHEIRLDMCSVDFTGSWQPGAIFRAMQDAADGNCHQIGQTFEELRQVGLAWVLSRAHLKMDSYPVFGQTVKVVTWPGKTRHMLFPRNYLFFCEGKQIGCATTLFLLLDLETRKSTVPARLPNEMPEYDTPAPMPFPGNLQKIEAEGSDFLYHPVYTDLDMNCHVNNTRYIDWFMNRFPVEKHQTQELSDLLIHYMNEVRPDKDIRLSLRDKDNVSLLTGSHDDTVCFGIQGTWRMKNNA